MYFQDLTPYTYPQIRGRPQGPEASAVFPPGLLHVGWLSPDHAFAKGPVPEQFLARLKRLCENPEIITLGFHVCELCPSDRQSKPHGSAEIHVRGHAGRAYAAPELIFHYVRDHGYQPPDEFVSAVLQQREA